MYLQVPLGLLEGSHNAKRAEKVSLGIRGYAWDDGVVGPLPRPQAVGVLGVQEEVVAPVVQREAAPLRDNACNKLTTLCDGVDVIGDFTRSGRFEEPFLGSQGVLGSQGIGVLDSECTHKVLIKPEPFYSAKMHHWPLWQSDATLTGARQSATHLVRKKVNRSF